MMKNTLVTLICTAVLICTAFVATSSAQDCAEFRGKTYIVFNEAKFDDLPDAAGAYKLTFDSSGKSGTARSLLVYTKEAQTVLQQSLTFTCGVIDGKYKYFGVTVDGKVDAGGFYYQSFDNGSRVWLKHNIAGRDTPFWMLEMPANPVGRVNFPPKKTQ